MKDRTTSTSLRLTVIMLALALVTSVFAVGTLSKYTIGGQADDNAQVAKWGVTIDIVGDNSFATQTVDTSIVSSSTHQVVAPGTNSSATEIDGDGIMVVTLEGTPEVDFQLTMDLGATKDIYLAAADYPDYTKAVGGTDPRVNFTLAANYYPVVFTLTHYYQDVAYSWSDCMTDTDAVQDDMALVRAVVASDNGDYALAETFTGTLATLDKLFENVSAKYAHVDAPNFVLDEQFKLEWEWVFENNNKADTLLGNLAADLVEGTDRFPDAGYDYNLTLSYEFTITIEQLDTDPNP